MGDKSKTFLEEEAYLKSVQNFLKKEIKELELYLDRQAEEDLSLKTEAYNEGLEFKDGTGVADSAQIQEVLRRNFHQHEEFGARLKLLRRLLPQPYFARLDLQMEKDGPIRPVYIGLRDLVDDKARKQWVVDWRSPVATLYYEADLGPNTYETPRGVRKVNLVDKRQYLIRHGELEEIYRHTDERYDKMLHDVLSEHASPRLKEIASTLQREQNQVIRTDPNRSLILAGVAGSGKSSIAMHRAAWILYRRPDLRAEDILLISPNEQFIDYISEILPSLQGERLRSMTFDDLCHELVNEQEARFRDFVFEKPTLERREIASDTRFAKAWEQYLAYLSMANFTPQEIHFGKQTISREEILELWDQSAKHIPLFERPQFVLSTLLERYRSKRILWHRDAVLNTLWEMIPVRGLSSLLERGLDYVKEETGLDLSKPEGSRMDQLDLSLMASLAAKLYAQPQQFAVKHLMVDEMQDLTLWQHRFIERLFDCPKTVLGDPHQALLYLPMGDYLQNLVTVYGGDEKVSFHAFHIAYRSSWEISEFSKRLVDADDEEIISLERYVDPVTVIISNEPEESLLKDFMTKEVDAITYAILCSNEDEAEELQDVAEQLGTPELKRKLDFDSTETQYVVMTPEEARGMEFDAVWIYAPTLPALDDVARRRALYVAATRALHELTLVTSEPVEKLEEMGFDLNSDYAQLIDEEEANDEEANEE